MDQQKQTASKYTRGADASFHSPSNLWKLAFAPLIKYKTLTMKNLGLFQLGRNFDVVTRHIHWGVRCNLTVHQNSAWDWEVQYAVAS